MNGPQDIERLIELMARLPGLGPRSARRAVLHMIRKKDLSLGPLVRAMAQVEQTVRECLNCGNLGTEDICEICADSSRETGELCVVEDVSDLWAMERSAAFKGRYHVLGGALSALDGVGPDDLKIPKLLDRVNSENVNEVILALTTTMEGQTTAHYIADLLGARVQITTLGQGVPIGGELDYLDEGTIAIALKARSNF